MAKPGYSVRTPPKHEVWRAILGQEIGAAEFIHSFPCNRFEIVELTAGDGTAIEGDIASTIISAMMGLHRWKTRQTPRIDIYFYEKASNTYKTLLLELKRQLPALTNSRSSQLYHLRSDGVWYSTDERTRIFVLNDDGKNKQYPPDRGTWYFINNDPNVITQWVLDARVLMPAVANDCRLLIYSAMGCNAGGVKRGPEEERPKWYDYVHHVIEATRGLVTIDLLLAAIKDDASQWAYLITTPRKWMEDRRKVVQNSFKKHGLEVVCHSFLTEEPEFRSLLAYLFDNHVKGAKHG